MYTAHEQGLPVKIYWSSISTPLTQSFSDKVFCSSGASCASKYSIGTTDSCKYLRIHNRVGTRQREVLTRDCWHLINFDACTKGRMARYVELGDSKIAPVEGSTCCMTLEHFWSFLRKQRAVDDKLAVSYRVINNTHTTKRLLSYRLNWKRFHLLH